MKKVPPEVRRAVGEWFSGHDGVIGRREACGLGLTTGQIDWLLRTGAWARVHPAVYRLTGAPLTARGEARAAVVAAGPQALASHTTAGWLWGLYDTAPSPPTVTVPADRVVRLGAIRVVRTRHPPAAAVRRGIPCTDPIRTIVDCATVSGPEEIDALVDRALARRVVRIDAIERACADRSSRFLPGRAALVERLHVRGITGSPAPSVLESRMARLFRRGRLPVPKAEVVWGPNRTYRLDFAYPDLRLAVEVDGWATHFTPEQQRYDNRRINTLSRAGWTVLRYNWWQVTYEGDQVAAEIAAAYRRLSA